VNEAHLRSLTTASRTDATQDIMYAVRNRRLGVASLAARSRGSLILQGYAAPIPVPAHLSGNRMTFEFPSPDDVNPADWMRGAEFVVIESRPLGDAIAHVTIPDFVLSSLRDITPPVPRQ
jgi:hypothetical protein